MHWILSKMWFQVGLLCLWVIVLSVQGEEDCENYPHEIDQEPKWQRWPSTTLYYRISNDFTGDQKANVTRALKVFNEETCLHFKEVSETAPAGHRLIYYKKVPDSCQTQVGYNPTPPDGDTAHEVSLADKCLWHAGTIQHETLHVLGFYHEHSRFDRDYYVFIDLDNILPDYQHNFDLRSQSNMTTFGVPYDFGSVMHYSKNAFAKDRSKPTIRARVGGEDAERMMGQREGPSESDLDRVRKMYCEPTKSSERQEQHSGI